MFETFDMFDTLNDSLSLKFWLFGVFLNQRFTAHHKNNSCHNPLLKLWQDCNKKIKQIDKLVKT